MEVLWGGGSVGKEGVCSRGPVRRRCEECLKWRVCGEVVLGRRVCGRRVSAVEGLCGEGCEEECVGRSVCWLVVRRCLGQACPGGGPLMWRLSVRPALLPLCRLPWLVCGLCGVWVRSSSGQALPSYLQGRLPSLPVSRYLLAAGIVRRGPSAAPSSRSPARWSDLTCVSRFSRGFPPRSLPGRGCCSP